jgi:hypothetical protein
MAGPEGAVGEAARSVVGEIEAASGKAVAEPADVSSFADVEAMMERVAARCRTDILVNNAQDGMADSTRSSQFICSDPPTAAARCGSGCVGRATGGSSSPPREGRSAAEPEA